MSLDQQTMRHYYMTPCYMTDGPKNAPEDAVRFLAVRVLQQALVDASGRRTYKLTDDEQREARAFVRGNQYAEFWCAIADVEPELLAIGQPVDCIERETVVEVKANVADAIRRQRAAGASWGSLAVQYGVSASKARRLCGVL